MTKKIKLPKLNFKLPFKVVATKKVEGTASIFFGSKVPMKIEKDKIETLLELFFDKYKKLVKDVSEEQKSIQTNPLSAEFLYDFFDNISAVQQVQNGTAFTMGGNGIVHTNALPQPDDDLGIGFPDSKDVAPEIKVQKKPIEVFAELERVPNPISLIDLDKKIEILKKKQNLAAQLYTQYDIKGAIERLENRKKYEEVKEFYNKFPYTHSDKINDLLTKYNLVLKQSDLFVPEFPDDAVEIMDAYQETTKQMCGKKPTFYVIATQDCFNKKYERRDPILLVQSPFGFFWQVLGAWDSEMILLSEL